MKLIQKNTSSTKSSSLKKVHTTFKQWCSLATPSPSGGGLKSVVIKWVTIMVVVGIHIWIVQVTFILEELVVKLQFKVVLVNLL